MSGCPQMSDMEQNLWTLANIITGFAVAQGLAFLYALGQSEFAKAVDNPTANWIILIATIVASILYCGAVYLIWARGSSLTDSQYLEIWKSVTLGRIAAISVFNGLVLLITIMRLLPKGS
jgi:hypothetical protein